MTAPSLPATTSPTGEADLDHPGVPTHWYNILADLPFDLPPDLPPPPVATGGGIATRLPLEMVRQSTARQAEVEIPAAVRQRYASWRPTPLVRAHSLEQQLGTRARIYYKYEGGNASGSHKLNSSVAQAYYYAQAGARGLATGTGAGQWGTALALAAHWFGMDCTVFMVEASYRQKPYRRVAMELFGAEVRASPSNVTAVGRRHRNSSAEAHGTLALAMAEAIEQASAGDHVRFSVGSGEAYAILHQTVIGIEAEHQLEAFGDYPDVVVAAMGAGSNFGGIAFPFLRHRFTAGRTVRCVSVEPQSCPKLTRGVYAYDHTDLSAVTPLERMYTLGNGYLPPLIHAGGLRYHAASKVVSALVHHGHVEAVAYAQSDVFRSGTLFARCEGIIPAPESAHAVHAAIVEAEHAREEGREPVILLCLSGHGLFDLAAYDAHLRGSLLDEAPTDEDLARARASLPAGLEGPETAVARTS
jgi:tryptophan synthase beta chain